MDKRKMMLNLDGKKNVEIVKEQKKSTTRDEGKFIPVLSLTSELGFSISLPIAGGAFLGQYLDNKFNTSPRMTLSLVFIGVFLAIINIYLIIKQQTK